MSGLSPSGLELCKHQLLSGRPCLSTEAIPPGLGHILEELKKKNPSSKEAELLLLVVKGSSAGVTPYKRLFY